MQVKPGQNRICTALYGGVQRESIQAGEPALRLNASWHYAFIARFEVPFGKARHGSSSATAQLGDAGRSSRVPGARKRSIYSLKGR